MVPDCPVHEKLPDFMTGTVAVTVHDLQMLRVKLEHAKQLVNRRQMEQEKTS